MFNMIHHFSTEEKLAAIRLVEQGLSARSVSDRLNLGHHLLYEWLEAYKLRGTEGLKPHKNRKKKHSYEEKYKIICEYQEKEVTLCRLSAKYDISCGVISNWVRLVEQGGLEALLPRKCGRKSERDGSRLSSDIEQIKKRDSHIKL